MVFLNETCRRQSHLAHALRSMNIPVVLKLVKHTKSLLWQVTLHS